MENKNKNLIENNDIELKQAIESINWKKIISDIFVDKYTSSDVDLIIQKTEKLFYSQIEPEEYEKELMQILKVSENEILNILNNLDNLIFKKIKSKLEYNSSDIPIPPYAKKESVQENLNKEKNIFEETGINMVEEKKVIEPTNSIEEKFSMDEDRDLVNSGISLIEEEDKTEEEHLLPNLETQKSVVNGIENPPTQNNNIIDQKLNSVFTSPQNTNNANIPPINKDPYRENI